MCPCELLRKDEGGKSTWRERLRPFSQRIVNRRTSSCAAINSSTVISYSLWVKIWVVLIHSNAWAVTSQLRWPLGLARVIQELGSWVGMSLWLWTCVCLCLCVEAFDGHVLRSESLTIHQKTRLISWERGILRIVLSCIAINTDL
jgi:hypothetical protein